LFQERVEVVLGGEAGVDGFIEDKQVWLQLPQVVEQVLEGPTKQTIQEAVDIVGHRTDLPVADAAEWTLVLPASSWVHPIRVVTME